MRFLLFLLLSICLVSVARADFFDPEGFLKTSGTNLLDRAGEGDVVRLRGVNLGGWLVMEGWQTPMDAGSLKDDWSVRDALTRRFGAEVKDSLISTYEDAWITEADLDHIAALGFNVIRLPFWYLTVQEEDGTWRKDAFDRMDWLVAHAWKRHIYTVLDFHGVPGGQSDGDSTGRVRKKDETGLAPDFWTNESNLQRTTEIWKAVAKHYLGYPGVAAYDLINEPTGAPSREALWKVYDRLYQAIREIDPDHVIAVEGCWGGRVNGKYMGWGLNVLPSPSQFNWTNVLYEVHAYNFDWNNLEKQQQNSEGIVTDIAAHANWNVPVFLGEFNCMGQAWDYSIDLYQKNNVNWAMWTYKATHGTGDDSWGVYNPKDPMRAKPDIEKDPAEAIRSKWQRWSTDAAFALNPKHARDLSMPAPADTRYPSPAGGRLEIPAPGVLAGAKDLNPNAEKLTARLVSRPAHGGTVSLSENGSFTYTPNGPFRGTDSFRYRVFDGKHESAFTGRALIGVPLLLQNP